MEIIKQIAYGTIRHSPLRSPWLDRKVVSLLSRFPPKHRLARRRAGNGFWLSGKTDNPAFLLGYHEAEYLRFLESNIRPGEVVYDIGANVGYLAFWLLAHPTLRNLIRVFAIEPEPENYQLLLENCRLNPELAMTPVQVALAGFDGELVLKSHGAGDGSARVVGMAETSDPTKMHTMTVPCRTLDGFVASQDARPNWLVIDVEGFAGEVLAGGDQTFLEAKPNVAVEIHHDAEYAAVAERLKRFGYSTPTRIDSTWGLHMIWHRPRGDR